VRRFIQAFTLVELLVVIAIVSTVAAILLPAFWGARGVVLRSACQSNLHQISLGSLAYNLDYDDRFMPINYQPSSPPNSRNDRTWVQMVLPYVGSFQVFQCPADFSNRPTPEATFDQDLVPGDTDSQYYTASLRSDYGYNYQNLAPVLLTSDGGHALTRETNDVSDPSNTVEFMDSVWSRNSSGIPFGGGNWLVVPPCRFYEPDGASVVPVDSFTGEQNSHVKVFTTSDGWAPQVQSASNLYGGAWPWHMGRLNVVEVDGSVKSLDPIQLSSGCDVQGQWAGEIEDPVAYMWDLR